MMSPGPTTRLFPSLMVPLTDGPLRILVTSLSGADGFPFSIVPPVQSVPPPETI